MSVFPLFVPGAPGGAEISPRKCGAPRLEERRDPLKENKMKDGKKRVRGAERRSGNS